MKISNWNPIGRPVNTALWPAGAVTTGPGPGGTGPPVTTTDLQITVKDEGTPLATAATSLDFVGAGVTATGGTAAKTITIPGASTLTVKEIDGSPSVAATEIDVPNGSLSVVGTVATMAYAQKTNGGRETQSVVAASGASQTLNLANGNLFDVTITAATLTLTFSGAVSGEVCSFTLWARQDGTGGRLVTWPGSVVWSGGVTPTLATAPNALDEFVFETTDGGTTWLGHHIGAGTALSTAIPLVESGTGSAGTGTLASKDDHVHPAAADTDLPASDHLHINDVQFTGDGSTAAFELPAAPFDAYSVAAFDNGSRTDVTLSGALLTTMTFGAAPTAGHLIIVDLIAAAA